jgi:hypothetical protein
MLRLDTDPAFTTGPIGLADLRECLMIRPSHVGGDQLGLPRALNVWKTLITRNDECGHVAVWRAAGRSRELAAVAISVFVTTQFADAEIAHPQPGLNARIVESVAEDRSVIADYDCIARANAAGTLSQVILYCNTRREVLSVQEDTVVRGMMTQVYGQMFAGYRLARMLTEVIGEQDWEAVANYPAIRYPFSWVRPYRASG